PWQHAKERNRVIKINVTGQRRIAASSLARTGSMIMDQKVDWQKLANALRELHRMLIERARRDYEREHSVTLNPGKLLQMLTTDAHFAWLRELSELIVDLDLVRGAAAAHQDEVADAVRAAVEHVI